MSVALALPIAHVGHYAWVLYVVPFGAVVFAIARSAWEQRRERDEDDEPGGD